MGENNMETLIFDQLAVLDCSSKLGKVIDFSSGINVITSSQEKDGSRAGKSVMMRSLFYAFGAETRFDRKIWDCGRSYFYIVKFHIGNEGYFVVRSGNFYRFLDQQRKEFFKTASRSELSQFLANFFKFPLHVYEQKSGLYEPADANSYFLFHFLEQDRPEVCSFSQFDGLSSDKTFY